MWRFHQGVTGKRYSERKKLWRFVLHHPPSSNGRSASICRVLFHQRNVGIPCAFHANTEIKNQSTKTDLDCHEESQALASAVNCHAANDCQFIHTTRHTLSTILYSSVFFLQAICKKSFHAATEFTNVQFQRRNTGSD